MVSKWFMRTCLSRYHVGIYTSITKENAEKKLESIFGKEIFSNIFGIWSREYTMPDPQSNCEWDTIKLIDIIRDNMGKNSYINHIILCDDSYNKVRYIQPNEVVVTCPVFSRIDYDDLLELIESKFNCQVIH